MTLFPLSVARRLVPVAAIALAAGGCAITFDARSLGVPAAMSAPALEPAVGDTFRVTARATHVFWGLYTATSPSLRNVLAGQLADGRAIQNLRIRVRRRWSDLLVTAATLGFVAPTSVTFEGVVARR